VDQRSNPIINAMADRVRMEIALGHLKNRQVTVSEVAFMLGFSEPCHMRATISSGWQYFNQRRKKLIGKGSDLIYLKYFQSESG